MFSHFSKASYISNIQDKIHPKDDPSLFGIATSSNPRGQHNVNQTDRLYMLFLYVETFKSLSSNLARVSHCWWFRNPANHLECIIERDKLPSSDLERFEGRWLSRRIIWDFHKAIFLVFIPLWNPPFGGYVCFFPTILSKSKYVTCLHINHYPWLLGTLLPVPSP